MSQSGIGPLRLAHIERDPLRRCFCGYPLQNLFGYLGPTEFFS